MKMPRFSAVIAGLSVASLLVAASLSADEQQSAQLSASARTAAPGQTSFVALQKKAKKKKRRKARGRLPNYYRAAGVTDEQREKIYSIQSSYREKIEPLEKQIAQLRAKMTTEIEAVLTPEQKKKVEELREAAAKKRKKRRKKRKSGTDK